MSFLREPDAEPIPGYRLIEPLGSGGFGEVWKCEAPGGLFKAMKIVYGNLNCMDAEGVRAEQELHALQRVKEVRHPFVCSLDRIEIVQGELVIVMELADSSLHDAFVEHQAAGLVGIPRDTLLRYIRDAAEALDHMIEKHGLLHLDIKPRNLFLISDRVKVADFGLVKHLERQSASGVLGGVTPLYAPPETLQNKISQQSDQYSLAIVYQELLTGQRPFNGKNARQLAMQHMNEEPELRNLPEIERPIVARALAKDPAKRWPNCLAFVKALYNARPARLETVSKTASGNRPKTMADTMEDMLLLDQFPEDELPPAKTPPPPADEDEEEIEVSQLGITVAQPTTGTLRPTVVIGIGSFGRRALLEMRCRFLDRFGDLNKIPLVRFLYIDSDPEAAKLATRGAPEVALGTGSVHPLPLQPVSNYRRRMLDHLNDWMPREKLYTIPRSLQTQGSRALGRLAFADNHLRFMTRLRREMQQATHPDTLYQSVSQTGLALRENLPRIYLVASAGGGGSGMLADLGYELRRLLKQLHFQKAEVIALLLCGAPGDPATPKPELANVYAALTELNHFHDPGSQFTAQYGPDAPRLVEQGPPYNSIYLLPLSHRTPELLRDAVAHVGSYVFHEVTTPLGQRLDRGRRARRVDGATPFRSFGTYAVWFPRGLLLRLAARQTCSRLLEEWQVVGEPVAPATVETACARAVENPEIRIEAISARIEEIAKVGTEGTPATALTAFLTRLEEQSGQSVALDDPGNWARQVMGRSQEMVGGAPGSAENESGLRKSKMGRALAAATQQLAQEWDERLARIAFELMEDRGRRLAAAEAAFKWFLRFCDQAVQAPRTKLEQQVNKTRQAWHLLIAATDNCVSGGSFSLFGGRSRRALRGFLDALAGFSRQRLAEETAAAGIQFFGQLHGRMEERIRELSFVRQRLRNLQEALEAPADAAESLATTGHFGLDITPTANTPVPSTEAYWDSIRQSDTARIVLPDGETDLERAAARFLEALTPDHWAKLDQALQDHVLAPLGGLHHICVSSGDLLRGLAGPLTQQATDTLGELLPITDVAQVEYSAAAAEHGDIRSRALSHFTHAAPLAAGKDESNQQSYLLLPASESGKNLGEVAVQVVPSLQLVRVAGQADLMFCREQGNLTGEDLHRLLNHCRAAYKEMSAVPATSPHARFDITDWVPLDP